MKHSDRTPAQKLIWTGLLILLLSGLVAAPAVYAQLDLSKTLAYQGYLTDADGNPLDGSVHLAFALYTSANGGTPHWEETQSNVRLDGGVFSVMLGSVEALGGVEFDRPYYLGVTVNGGDELAPRVALGAAPVSLYAHEVARGAAVHSINGLTNNVVLEAGNNVTLSEADGIITIDAEAAALALPFDGQVATEEPALKLTNTGTGVGLDITSHGEGALRASTTGDAISILASTTGSASALSALTSGSGSAGFFRQFNPESGRPALFVTTNGAQSEAGHFSNTNTASDAFVLSAVSEGTSGAARFVHNGGQGTAAVFEKTDPSNTDPAVVIGQQDLGIQDDEFFNDGLVVQGEAPMITLFGKRFQQNTRSGLVLAGVDDSGNVQDRWGIVRQFFPGNGLHFTFGSDADPTQNPTLMLLSSQQEGVSLGVSGTMRGERILATEDLGASSTPATGGYYRDNVVYAWADVGSAGQVVDGFGCTVERTATGTYRLTLRRALPEGVSVIVTPRGLGSPLLASAVSDGSTVDVVIRRFAGGTFDLSNNAFYVQVVGRP